MKRQVFSSSFTQNNQIKIYNHLDLVYHGIPLENFQKELLGLYVLIINGIFVNFILSISEYVFQSEAPGKQLSLCNSKRVAKSDDQEIQIKERFEVKFLCDIYNGFICKDECKNIKIYIGEELFEEFNNCKYRRYGLRTPKEL